MPVSSTSPTATTDTFDTCVAVRISIPRAVDVPSAGNTASPAAIASPPQTPVTSTCSVCMPIAAESGPASAACPSDALPAAIAITASHSSALRSMPV